jgi:hypothetical protein
VVLLALATNPSWAGLPYCGPVMNQLFSTLNSGGPWPKCGAANISPVGYIPRRACPSGSSAMSLTSSSSGSFYAANSGDDYCAESLPTSSGARGGCRNAAQSESQCLAISARPANPTPYFVDITTAAGVRQFRFALTQ